jgi:hypothetical protein
MHTDEDGLKNKTIRVASVSIRGSRRGFSVRLKMKKLRSDAAVPFRDTVSAREHRLRGRKPAAKSPEAYRTFQTPRPVRD